MDNSVVSAVGSLHSIMNDQNSIFACLKIELKLEMCWVYLGDLETTLQLCSKQTKMGGPLHFSTNICQLDSIVISDRTEQEMQTWLKTKAKMGRFKGGAGLLCGLDLKQKSQSRSVWFLCVVIHPESIHQPGTVLTDVFFETEAQTDLDLGSQSLQVFVLLGVSCLPGVQVSCHRLTRRPRHSWFFFELQCQTWLPLSFKKLFWLDLSVLLITVSCVVSRQRLSRCRIKSKSVWKNSTQRHLVVDLDVQSSVALTWSQLHFPLFFHN